MSKKIHPHDYKIEIIKLRDGDQEGFEFYIPALKSHVFGDTIQEALEGYMEFFDDEVKYRKEKGIPMPKPDSTPDLIKQVPLRISQSIYQRINEKAKKKGHSFNRFVANLLEQEVSEEVLGV